MYNLLVWVETKGNYELEELDLVFMFLDLAHCHLAYYGCL